MTSMTPFGNRQKRRSLKKLHLPPSSPTTSANKSNDPSNTDITNEILASSPPAAPANAPNVASTDTRDIVGSLQDASDDAMNTITTVSKALDATNTNTNSPADPATYNTNVSLQAPANAFQPNTNTNPQADPTINNTSNSSQTSEDPASNNTNTENDPTTRPSATQDGTSLLYGLSVTLNDINVDCIKSKLTDMGLNTTGRKQELIDRLRDHLNQHPNPPTPII